MKRNKLNRSAHISLILILLSSFSLFFGSCHSDQIVFIDASKANNLREVKLGESNFYLSLPEKFTVSEARGKEGQLGYSLIPLDTTIEMNGFIEIVRGNPIGDTYRGEPGKVCARSYLLDKKVKWIIYQSRDGDFTAYTNESGELNATVSAKNRKDIESMISIIATLKKK